MTVEEMATALLAGDRRALARAITLAESTRPDHRAEAEDLLDRVLDGHAGAIRLGISGAPGVGKSTFIEAFGRHLTGLGLKVAVLAVDPSSNITGGSILGDKTRMPDLARDERAFIRPSPSGGGLGGVARRTREAILLCEAAGHDAIIVETVGVGQSEATVAEMVDMFVLLLAPGGGDELQGIKRGVMELADLVVINKADGDFLKAARHAAADYASALTLIRAKSPHWTPEVALVSAAERTGMAEVWDTVERFRAALEAAGAFESQRRDQARRWLWREVEQNLIAAARADKILGAKTRALESEVEAGALSPSVAARRLVDAILKQRPTG